MYKFSNFPAPKIIFSWFAWNLSVDCWVSSKIQNWNYTFLFYPFICWKIRWSHISALQYSIAESLNEMCWDSDDMYYLFVWQAARWAPETIFIVSVLDLIWLSHQGTPNRAYRASQEISYASKQRSFHASTCRVTLMNAEWLPVNVIFIRI